MAKVFLDQGTIGMDVVLLLDELYLQKDAQYQNNLHRLVKVMTEVNV